MGSDNGRERGPESIRKMMGTWSRV